MDQITLLRTTRDDVAEPTPETLARARARLVQRATTTRRPVRRTRALLAAVAVVALVVAAIGLWPGSSAPATAADLLHRAADATGDDPVAGPGQYLAVETHEDALGYVQGPDDAIAGAYRFRTVSTTYVPHDQDGTWVRRTWSEAPTTIYGGAVVAAGAARDYAEDAKAEDPNVERARGGSFGNGELSGDPGVPGTDDLAAMPRDPEQLLAYLSNAPGVSTSKGEKVIGEVSTLLRTGLVPRDLRAAMYDALALLPGVVVVDDQAALDGRIGTAIGVHVGSSIDAVVIDTGTGEYLGQRQVQTKRIGAVPAGTVMDQTSVRLTVVSALP